jgi:hypothetical protein
MTTWDAFAAAAPEIAAAGRRLLAVPGFGFGYLATVRADGAPRIHPINPVWAGGAVVAFIVPSPKLRDLERDGRYALHSTGSAEIDDEFSIAGRARIVVDPSLRRAALAACPYTPADDHVLVELDLERALWAHYEPRGVFPPQYHVWPRPRPTDPNPGREHP